FHSGTLSTHAKGLLKVQPEGFLALNPAEAARRGIVEGGSVRVRNARGAVRTVARLLDRVPPGIAFFPEHFAQEVRRLVETTVEPESGALVYRPTWVEL